MLPCQPGAWLCTDGRALNVIIKWHTMYWREGIECYYKVTYYVLTGGHWMLLLNDNMYWREGIECYYKWHYVLTGGHWMLLLSDILCTDRRALNVIIKWHIMYWQEGINVIIKWHYVLTGGHWMLLLSDIMYEQEGIDVFCTNRFIDSPWDGAHCIKSIKHRIKLLVRNLLMNVQIRRSILNQLSYE